MPTKIVLQEVRGAKWFQLSEDDLDARYPLSRKEITNSVIKFGRKNLTIKGEIFPAGEGAPIGVWRITIKGIERALKERELWRPRYTNREAVLIEERES